MKTRLLLTRHAEAEGNINRLFHGWTDSSITEKGHIQAAMLAERLKGTAIDVIYSSTLKRALQTAQYIAGPRNMPVLTSDKLREINGGKWEDMKWSDLARQWPEAYAIWDNEPHRHRMPEGETMEGFFTRLSDEIGKIVAANPGKNICIVTHGTAIRALMCLFKGCGLTKMCDVPWYDNTSVSIIDYDENEGYKIIMEGDATHLDKSMSTIRNQDWWIELMDDKREE